MSEKTAKADRRAAQTELRVVYQTTVTVFAKPDGGFRVEVEGFPPNHDDAMRMMADASLIISKKFVELAAAGKVKTLEPSRIVPATMIPKFKM